MVRHVAAGTQGMGGHCMYDPQLIDDIRTLDQEILLDPANSPERLRQMTEAQRAGGLLHGDRPICPFLRPHIIPLSEYQAIAHTAETIAFAFERMARKALTDDALLDELGMTGREIVAARIDPGYERFSVTSRLDTYLTNGGFSFLEYNAESPAGIGDQMVLEDMLFSLPHVRRFVDSHPHIRPRPHHRLLEALVSAYRDWGGDVEFPRIAIFDWEGVPTESEFRILKNYFESEGYPTVIADPRQLHYDAKTLSVENQRIDIVYKRILIHEYLTERDESDALWRAYVDGNICMANSFRSKLAHKKASFAIISDPRFAHLFEPHELDAARKHIPWTRRVRDVDVDYRGRTYAMRDLLLECKNRLVLKPNDDYGGHGVAIGYACDDATWRETIKSAIETPYVVQELLDVRRTAIPLYVDDQVHMADLLVDFDPYLFNNRVDGGMVRLSATSLSNVSSGGGETALLVVGNR